MSDLSTLLPNYWAALEWLPVAITCAVVIGILMVWSWTRGRTGVSVRVVGMLAKTLAVILIAMILLEPMRSEMLPQTGANLFLIMADDSQSLTIKDRGQRQSRGERLKAALDREAAWQVRLGQEFDTRRYLFDSQVRPVDHYQDMAVDGEGSSLLTALETVSRRYEGRPNAGILLLTDGNATDLPTGAADLTNLPPVYPVVLGNDDSQRDVSIRNVTTSQTNFEAAPVSVAAEIITHGYAGKTIVAELLDEEGNQLDRQQVRNVADDRPFALRFQTKPARRGVLFYRLRVYAEGEAKQFEEPETSAEATLANNTRLIMVDRGGGPYRILYVSGRPNWEFKFLRRALADDDEVKLFGLVRIAKREPKFTFRDRNDNSSRLFKNSDADQEQVERYDEPVLVRIGVEDSEQLQSGFPETAEDLFGYHAVVLDDLEAEFFTQDQQALLQKFVSVRGGGFLMLGGQESYVGGKFAHTSIGEMLPVYTDRGLSEPIEEEYRLVLTREGWLEPWVRVRPTESEERRRLSTMAPFKTVNRLAAIKPGARVLARVESQAGNEHPALVVQSFGKGRTASLLIGDMWRWQMRAPPEENDLEKAWRQTCRWLVADVPGRIEIEVKHRKDEPNQPVELKVKVSDAEFRPLDNATVATTITTPGGDEIELTAEPVPDTSGVYEVSFVPREAGGYRAMIRATDDDASEIGERETGWVAEPTSDEFRELRPGRELLTRIARETGGEVVELDRLDRFVANLPNRKIPITQQKVRPVWHTWLVLFTAVGLLVTEWGLRRWKGLP